MADWTFIDHSEKVKEQFAGIAMAALEEAAGELESQVKRNTVVDTGKTKNSWQHRVGESEGQYMAYVGSDYQNAIWEEFGTGEYALKGDGRKGGWFYEDAKGVGHFTHGKPARRPFWKAYTSKKSSLISMIRNKFKGGIK